MKTTVAEQAKDFVVNGNGDPVRKEDAIEGFRNAAVYYDDAEEGEDQEILDALEAAGLRLE